MPGSGKSYVGSLLHRKWGMTFVDTDHLIGGREGRGLQEILESHGEAGFKRLEEEAILALCAINPKKAVIATGGSAVYSEKAMNALKASSLVIHLDAPVEDLKANMEKDGSPNERGILGLKGKTVDELLRERQGLYEKYADMTISLAGSPSEDQVMAEIMAGIQRKTGGLEMLEITPPHPRWVFRQ